MAAERIDIDVSKALADIARLKGGMADLKKEIGQVGAAGDAAFDEGFALGMVDALDDLQREYAEMARAAKVLQNAMRGATEPALIKTYAQSIAQLETGMRKLEGTAKTAGVNLKQANKEAGTGKQVFESFFGAFTKATIIIAAIEAVRRFASQALDLATQTKKASLQFEAFLGSAEKAQKVVGELQSFAGKKLLPTQEVLDAGKGLLAFGVTADRLTPTLSQIADISKATGKNFGELTTIFGKAKAAGVLYAEDINQLVDAGIPIIGEFAKQLGVGTDQVKKLASEGKITFEELQLAFFNLTAEGGKFAGQAEAGADAGDRFNVAWTNALTKVGVVLKPAWDFVLNSLTGILDSVSKLASSTGFTSFAENAFRAMAKLTPAFALLEKITDKLTGKKGGGGIDEQADKDAYAADRRAYEENLNERERLEKEAAAARLRRNKTNNAEAAKLEKELARLRIEAMAEGMAKEIAQENLRFSELKRQLEKYHIDTTGAVEQHNKNILGIELKYTLQRLAAESELIELRKAQAEYEKQQSDKSLAAQKKYLEQTKAIQESEVDITEAEFNNLIKALAAGGAKKEDVEKAQLEFDEQLAAKRIQIRIDFLKGLLAITDAGNKAEITLITNQITTLQTQLEGLGEGFSGGGGKPKSLLELIGIDLDSEQLSELEKGIDNIASIFGELAGAQEDAADAAVDAAEKQIEAAQRVLDEQRRLYDEGYASDVSNAERNLEAAKAQEAKALEQKKKAQRQQALLDTASQVSSLITASAQTLKVFNGPLLPIGIALVAAMFGAFLAAKARASQAAKFRHGGEGKVDGNSIIVGASHEGGGVGIEAEGGEFFGTDGKRFGVVNKKMTAKHFDLISAINKDDRAKMREALESLTRPNMKRDAVMGAVGEGAGSMVVIRGGSDKKTHSLLSDIKKNGQSSRTVEGNYVVEKRGNYTRKMRIR